MRTRLIHLINPKTDSVTTRPQYFNRALYSPLAGLLAERVRHETLGGEIGPSKIPARQEHAGNAKFTGTSDGHWHTSGIEKYHSPRKKF